MKIAITAQGNNSEAVLDTRFGRANCFMIFDTENKVWECAANTQNVEAAQGAGIQAAQHILDKGAEILITSQVGPKADKVLKAGKVKVFTVTSSMTVSQALDAMLRGELTQSAD